MEKARYQLLSVWDLILKVSGFNYEWLLGAISGARRQHLVA
jgi:hypothetical protein